MLAEKYGNGKPIEPDYFQCKVKGRSIIFDYEFGRYRHGAYHGLQVYLDISSEKEYIQQLCRIHFHTYKIDGRDFITHHTFHNSFYLVRLQYLVKKSDKAINRAIQKTDNYIAEKERERLTQKDSNF